jgi:hypothetical protein
MPTNDNIYKVNWFKLVSWVLPNIFFKPKMFTWCKALVAPIVIVHNDLLVFRNAKLYDLTIDIRIGSIVSYLNKRYDATNNSIYISNGQRGVEQFIFLDTETESDYVFDAASTEQMYVYNNNEVGAAPAQFIVWLPLLLQPKELEIFAVVKQICLPSKRFQIQYF